MRAPRPSPRSLALLSAVCLLLALPALARANGSPAARTGRAPTVRHHASHTSRVTFGGVLIVVAVGVVAISMTRRRMAAAQSRLERTEPREVDRPW